MYFEIFVLVSHGELDKAHEQLEAANEKYQKLRLDYDYNYLEKRIAELKLAQNGKESEL